MVPAAPSLSNKEQHMNLTPNHQRSLEIVIKAIAGGDRLSAPADMAWISDPGHAWLAVDADLITDLMYVPTKYSYFHFDEKNQRSFVFLEEDLDLGIFVDLLLPDMSDEEQQTNMKSRTVHFTHPDHDSFVRSLQPFPSAMVAKALTERGCAFVESSMDAAAAIYRKRKERGLLAAAPA